MKVVLGIAVCLLITTSLSIRLSISSSPFLIFNINFSSLQAEELIKRPQVIDNSELFTISVSVRKKEFAILCYQNTPGLVREKNGTARFIPFTHQLRKLRKKGKKGSRSYKTTLQKMRKSKNNCDLSLQNIFNESGFTTQAGRIILKIPSGYTGSISEGKEVYENECLNCHLEKKNRSFETIKKSIVLPPMFKSLKIQEIVDLTAYLNRGRN